MFRGTATFLVVFLILHHDFAAAHNIQYEGAGIEERDKKEVPQTEVSEVHSRQKRRVGSLIRGFLSLTASGSFALSVGTTLYHAIRKCKDYKPSPCKSPNCTYVKPCPDVCRGPDKNRKYVLSEKKVIKKRLDLMDKIQLNAFNLATKTINVGINNKRILTEIDRINDRVDTLMFDIADLDINIATKFRNKTVEIKKLLRNQRLSLQDVLNSPEMQGIFDKWTWEGTGVFAISIALPIGLKLFTFIRERYAIHKLYKEMKADFSKRFINQRSAQGGFRQPKLHNKFAYVQGYSTKGVNSQIKKTAKAIYKSRQANQKVSKIEKFTTKYLTPAINAIVTALSAWATYQQIDYCQTIANDMQNTSITVTNQRNKIEDMKVNLVDPVLRSVQSRWSRVKSFMAKKTTLDWLDGIKKLSLGAKSPDVTAANTIQDFISKIASAGVHNTLKLQTKLIKALKSVEFEFECLRDKQHAVTLVVKDCRTGRAPLNELYKDADSKYRLNRRKCIDSKRVPYTSFKQFRQIVKQIANKQKWSCKCLLNNRDLLIRVCDEKLKGHTTPEEILKQVNKKELDKSMVLDFLKRCPPPKITRKKRINTCKNYCRYMSVADMAKLELLWEKQVRQIIIKCPICSVSPSQKNTICYDYFCKRIKATTIEAKVRKPLPTVKHVIRKVCTQKCVPKAADKKKICRMYKCKVFSLSKIAKSLGLPLASVKKTTARCDIILPSCGPISAEDRKKVLNLHCKFNASAESIHAFKLVDLPLSAIKYIIRSTTCKEFKKKNKSG